MPSAPPYAVRRLKTEGRRSVWLIRRPDGIERTVKIWPIRPGMLLKLATGRAQPQRQRRAAVRLLEAGILTPAPHRLGPAWRSGPVIELELAFIPGRSALTLLNEGRRNPLPAEEQVRLAREIGTIVRDLASAGLFNRDLKLENLIIDHGQPSRVWVIDPVGVRAMRDPVIEIARMLERLAVQPVELGLPVPRSIVMGVIRAALTDCPATERRRILKRVRRLVTGAATPTPKAAGGT